MARAIDFSLLRGSAFLVGGGFAACNLLAVRHSVRSLRLPRRVGNLEFSEEVSSRILTVTALVLAAIAGIALSLPHQAWMNVELLRSGIPFGETDPYFRLDLGRWVYQYPLENSVQAWSMVALLSMTVVVLFLYSLTPSLKWEQGRLVTSGYVRRHLFLLGAVLLLLLAWGYRLDALELLHNGTGPSGALSAQDHRVGIPANLALALIGVAASMLVAWAGWSGQVRLAFITITFVLLATLTVRQLVPAVASRFVTGPDIEAQEAAYRNIRNAYTRRAYAVDEIAPVGVGEDDPDGGSVLRGASIWDGEALRRAIGEARQGARPSGSMGWEPQGGRLTAYVLEEPLGPDPSGVDPAWVITRVAADIADDRGDVVPRDTRSITGIIVSDSAPTYFVVPDTGGVVAGRRLGSFVDRLAHAWHLQNASLLSRRPGEPPRRVILRRDLRDRVRSLYPFFLQDTHAAPIVWRDSVFWSVHLYATSDAYPLSAPMLAGGTEVRYLHHAAVALVNAMTGRVMALPSPQPSPVAASWIQEFPELFTDAGTLEPDLLARIPPPVDGAWILAQGLSLAGLRGEYEPRGHLPAQSMDSLFTRASMPPFLDAATGRLALAIPVLDPSDALRGLLVVAGGADGEARFERMAAPGPKWIRVADELYVAMDSARVPSPDTRPVSGPVRMVPSSQGPLAFATLYDMRPDGRLQVRLLSLRRPEGVVTGKSLLDAAGLPEPVVSEGPITPEEFLVQAGRLYESMRQAMRRGDWRGIGAAYDALGRLLRSVRKP